jgi:glucose/arabinose dehydrogenase
MKYFCLASLTITMVACGASEPLPEGASFGANPTLPAPDTSLIPTVRIAPAKGWSGDKTPKAAEGFKVNAFAAGLDHPRWLYVLPNGDVLVADDVGNVIWRVTP